MTASAGLGFGSSSPARVEACGSCGVLAGSRCRADPIRAPVSGAGISSLVFLAPAGSLEYPNTRVAVGGVNRDRSRSRRFRGAGLERGGAGRVELATVDVASAAVRCGDSNEVRRSMSVRYAVSLSVFVDATIADGDVRVAGGERPPCTFGSGDRRAASSGSIIATRGSVRIPFSRFNRSAPHRSTVRLERGQPLLGVSAPSGGACSWATASNRHPGQIRVVFGVRQSTAVGFRCGGRINSNWPACDGLMRPPGVSFDLACVWRSAAWSVVEFGDPP